jgi:response regulator RpfG family c-di-GMP phosphodiesterase
VTVAVDLPRVLFVDDEPHILDALRRQLRREFAVETAVGAAKGLFALGQPQPFEVIVSDFLMPGINGAQFLAQARKAAPTATRMLLTGHTSLGDAAITVNEGQVFRMLLKPVDQATITAALHDCVSQHRLIVSERELLEQTLKGSVKALTDVLSLVSPAAFGRAARMRVIASAILDVVGTDDRWAIELAVQMSQLGVVSLPPTVAEKLEHGGPLTDVEQAMVDHLPAVAEELISSIPRLAPVAEAIHYSHRGYDGSGEPHHGPTGDRIPFGARMLRLVQDRDVLIGHGASPAVALATLRTMPGPYDPALLEGLAAADLAAAGEVHGVMLADLQIGMVLATAVTSRSGVLLVNPGQEITMSLITRVRNFAELDDGVAEPIMVRQPAGVSPDPEPTAPATG